MKKNCAASDGIRLLRKWCTSTVKDTFLGQRIMNKNKINRIYQFSLYFITCCSFTGIVLIALHQNEYILSVATKISFASLSFKSSDFFNELKYMIRKCKIKKKHLSVNSLTSPVILFVPPCSIRFSCWTINENIFDVRLLIIAHQTTKNLTFVIFDVYVKFLETFKIWNERYLFRLAGFTNNDIGLALIFLRNVRIFVSCFIVNSLDFSKGDNRCTIRLVTKKCIIYVTTIN